MIDFEEILRRHITDNPDLLRIVTLHSQAVARKAIDIARSRSLQIDTEFVVEAAMLHDIGVVECDAPGISCFGTRPYICHGIEGKKILENESLPRHALVCERHTGAGITAAQILHDHLPLPPRDMLPVSPEEKLICYADKFFSKSRKLDEEKPIEKIISQMEAHGPDTLQRFLALHALFAS